MRDLPAKFQLLQLVEDQFLKCRSSVLNCSAEKESAKAMGASCAELSVCSRT